MRDRDAFAARRSCRTACGRIETSQTETTKAKAAVATIQITQPGSRCSLSSQNPPTVRFAQRLRQLARTRVALALLSAVWAQAPLAFGGSNRHIISPGARDVTMFQRNLCVGTEFTPLLTLDPTDPNYVRNLLMGVAEVYQAIVASDLPTRAHALAREIAATQPDLAALQEGSLIRTQELGDGLFGGTTPATEVQSGAAPGMLARNGRWCGMEVACKPGMNLQPVLLGCFRKRVVIPPGVKRLLDTSARHAWRRRFVSGSGTPNE